MAFVFDNAPDPMGDQGLPGTQKYVLEDVPRKVQKYGKETAFFSTNCGMQEPLIRAVMDGGGLFPEQCCPSPTHGYPGALGISIAPEVAGDMDKICQAITAEVVKHGEHGRMATWPVSTGIVDIEAATELAILAVQGTIKLNDMAAVKREVEKAAGNRGVQMVAFQNTNNYFMYVMDSVVF